MKITNFQSLTTSSLISFTIYSITNPNLAGSQTITLSILDASSNTIETTTFSATFTTPAFTPYSLSPTIIAFPDNANVYAKYTFTFTAGFSIPANSKIIITFPASYGLLYGTAGASNIQCISSGGLTYLKGCNNVQVDAFQTIQIDTLSQSMAGEEITIDYYGLVLYSTPMNNIPGFTMEIYYDTILIASSGTLTTSITKAYSTI